MRFINVSGIAAGAVAALLTIQLAAAHTGETHTAPPAAPGFGLTEFLGVLAVAIVVVLIFRLINRGDSVPESPDWPSGPTPGGVGPEGISGHLLRVSGPATGTDRRRESARLDV